MERSISRGADSAVKSGKHPASSRLQRAAVPRNCHDAATGGTMFGIVGWIVFGLIVGVVAKLLMPGRDPGGIIVTMLLGIAGALVGGFIGRAMGLYGENDAAGIFMSILGAVVLLFAYRKMVRPRQLAA
jgi:uncharacterized membrane protein YeaQ/YmgE (transglycosylase-associated protein family)